MYAIVLEIICNESWNFINKSTLSGETLRIHRNSQQCK